MSDPYDIPTGEPDPRNQPTLAMEVASLVQGYVDDKMDMLRFELQEHLTGINDHLATHEEGIRGLRLAMGGVRDGLYARLEEIEGQLNLPEHVYKNFIKSEAERLRIVKPVRKVEE